MRIGVITSAWGAENAFAEVIIWLGNHATDAALAMAFEESIRAVVRRLRSNPSVVTKVHSINLEEAKRLAPLRVASKYEVEARQLSIVEESETEHGWVVVMRDPEGVAFHVEFLAEGGVTFVRRVTPTA